MNERKRLFTTLFLAYLVALLIGTIFIEINIVVFNELTLIELLQFNIPFLLISDTVIAILLIMLTRWRLRSFLSVMNGNISSAKQKPNKLKAKDSDQLFKLLLRFPYELFASVIGLALMFMALFHGLDILRAEVNFTLQEDWSDLLISICSELSLTCIVALMLLSLSRATLRPYMLSLQVNRSDVKLKTILISLYIVALTCLVIIVLVTARLGVLMAANQAQAEMVASYAFVLMLYMLVAFSGFRMLVKNWQADLAIINKNLWWLSSHEQVIPQQGIPIFSEDESAGLALAFNKLQQQLKVMHGELAEQLTLARDIQQRLLPTTMPSAAPLQVAAYCQPCYEVGGDFYDVIKLDEHRFVVAIGDVSGKGMSAAMLMSAILAALRAEVAHGRSAGEILSAINKQIYRITQGRSFVTLGLAIIEEREQQATVDYASAGHMVPYVLSEDGRQLQEIDISALPLGMVEDESYIESKRSFQLSKGQVLVMYTDGVVEALDQEEQLFGFERWEQALLELNIRQRPLSHALQHLLQQLPTSSAQRKAGEDDRTVVLVRYNKLEETKVATSIEEEGHHE